MITQRSKEMFQVNYFAIPGVTNVKDIRAIKVSSRIAEKRHRLTPGNIVNLIVEQVFEFSYDMLMVKNREKDRVLARQAGMLLLLLLKNSTIKSGAHYNKNHSTVVYSRNACNNILETRFPRTAYDNLKTAINALYLIEKELDLTHLTPGWNEDL